MILSFVEENYLKTICHLSDNGQINVSTNAIADILNTKPASVTDMIRKLAEKKILHYQKYKGVQMTTSGKKIALQIIRKHRLWEVFLVEKLGFNWDQVHEIAEQMEHIKSPLLVSRLDEFLGFPTSDPHGDPIPDKNGEFKEYPKVSLNEMGLQTEGIVVKVPDGDASLLRHLAKINMRLGSKVKILDKVEFDGSLHLKIDQSNEVYLSGEISKNIMITLK